MTHSSEKLEAQKKENRAILSAMSEEQKKIHSRIRTFASDLEAQRKKTGKDIATKEVQAEKTEKDEGLVSEPRREHVHIPETEITPREIKTETVETPIVKDRAKVNTKIPSYHEIQKQISSFNNDEIKESTHISVSEKESKQPKISKSNKPIRANIGYDATVITDTKSKDFNFFSEIFASIKSWFRAATAKKKKPIQKYSVTGTDLRKGVIQKATSKTGTIFTADNETIKEQIRKRRQQDKELEAAKADEPETIWSPYTETGYNLLEAPDKTPDVTKNVTIEYKRPRTESIAQTEPVVVANIENDEVETWGDLDESSNVDSPTEASRFITPFVTEEETQPVTLLTSDYDKEYSSEEEQDSSAKNSQRLINIRTNILAITLLIMVVGFVIILFTARIITQQLNTESTNITVSETSTKPIIGQAQIMNATLTNDAAEQLPQLIKSTIETAPMGLIEIPVISQTGKEITPSYLLEVLGFKTLSNFRGSLITSRFATINHSDPILIMKFVDEYTIRGGLLSWEKTMASDMSNLYEIPSDVVVKFTDETIGDTDVRLLRHDNKILIIYGIIDNNTILITSNVSDFAQINELGFSD